MGHPWVEFWYYGRLLSLDRIEGFFLFFGFQVPSGWGHPFRVESTVRARSQLKEFLGRSFWRHIAVPPPLFNVGTHVLYMTHSGNVY